MLLILILPVYLFFCYYLFRRSYQWMGSCTRLLQGRWFLIADAAVYWSLAASPVAAFFLESTPYEFFMKRVSNFWLGVFLYIILLSLILEAVRLILKKTHLVRPEFLQSRKVLALTGGTLAVTILAVSIYGTFHAGKVYHTEYDVAIAKSGGNNSDLTIAFVSDLHLGYSIGVHHIEKMVEEINAMDADLVCIAGDIFDNDYGAIQDPERLIALFQKVQSRYGIYACYGNHDLDEPILLGFTFQGKKKTNDERLRDFLNQAGIRLLEDESVLIDDSFYLIGRKDRSRVKKTETSGRLTPAELTKHLDLSKPVLAMDHQPRDLAEMAEAGVDLDLSGHTHDGQLWPFTLLIQAMWENSYGRLTVEFMTSIVTSGLGLWGPNMRVGTNSEIVEIHVTFTP